MLSNCQNLKPLDAENDGGKRFTAMFKVDVILHMHRQQCGL